MTAIRRFEPTYRTIRERLMTGFWRPGYQLVTPSLAEELDVSMSPVRDSLCYLAGQNMVVFRPSAGFFVPTFDEAHFCALLDLQRLLLHAAVAGGPVGWLEPLADGDQVERTTALFEHIAGWSGNFALVQSVRNLGDRLHVFKRLDSIIVPKWRGELEVMENAVAQSAPDRVVRDLLSRYHAVRKRHARHFIRLHGEGVPP